MINIHSFAKNFGFKLAMPKDKGPEWNHVVVLDGGGEKGIVYASMKWLYCDETYSGGVKRINRR